MSCDIVLTSKKLPLTLSGEKIIDFITYNSFSKLGHAPNEDWLVGYGNKADCEHEGPRSTSEMPFLGVLLNDPSPYVREFEFGAIY